MENHDTEIRAAVDDGPVEPDVLERAGERHAVELVGKYRAPRGQSRDIWVKDVSRTGCRFFDRYSILEVGTTISFRIGNIGPLYAEVRWRERSTVGIRFEQPLHESVLGHIVSVMDANAHRP